jgi:hypothetical protein
MVEQLEKDALNKEIRQSNGGREAGRKSKVNHICFRAAYSEPTARRLAAT